MTIFYRHRKNKWRHGVMRSLYGILVDTTDDIGDGRRFGRVIRITQTCGNHNFPVWSAPPPQVSLTWTFAYTCVGTAPHARLRDCAVPVVALTSVCQLTFHDCDTNRFVIKSFQPRWDGKLAHIHIYCSYRFIRFPLKRLHFFFSMIRPRNNEIIVVLIANLITSLYFYIFNKFIRLAKSNE